MIADSGLTAVLGGGTRPGGAGFNARDLAAIDPTTLEPVTLRPCETAAIANSFLQADAGPKSIKSFGPQMGHRCTQIRRRLSYERGLALLQFAFCNCHFAICNSPTSICVNLWPMNLPRHQFYLRNPPMTAPSILQ